MNSKRTALITGVTGQDGAYLARFLIDACAYHVVGVSSRRSGGTMWRLHEMSLIGDPLFEYRTMDVTCYASIQNVIKDVMPDEIYNLAAQSFVAESFISPTSTANINYLGVLNMLEAMRAYCPDARFYQASTSEMFGGVNAECQDESTPFHPRSPYAVSKAAAHYAVQNYREAYGLHASCGILFNHESPLRGIEFVTRKVTDGVAQILAGKRDKILLGNLDAKRDWGHAQDYVRAMYLMLQQDNPDDYVIATGRTFSVREMVDVVFDAAGLSVDEHVELDKRFMRPSDVPVLCGNPEKAKRVLGWEPKISFQEMMRDMLFYDADRHGVDLIKMISIGDIHG